MFGVQLCRMACGAAISVVIVCGETGAAAATAPPGIDPGALGSVLGMAANPAPPAPTEQRSVCAEPALSGVPPREAPIAQRVLDLPDAWRFSRGAGQRIAIIDTGVHPHPRLAAVQPGGDYVSQTDGTVDCDGHGTLVAGIAAARPGPDDGFAGVAPDATILSIRQVSLAYEAKNGGARPPDAIEPTGYGTVSTLAAAVVRAVRLGATVIDISEEACVPAGTDTGDAALGAAVKYAHDSNVVVVAAAGDVRQDGGCRAQNTGTGWAAVRTVATPAWFAPDVLPVASVDPDGTPSDLSLHGPWIGVAAIGRKIVSLDSGPGGAGLVNSVRTEQGSADVQGTGFAAAAVAGLAALVRARFPDLTAAQVIDRIERTAHAPGTGRDDLVGHGLIDPVAALTAILPDAPAPDAAGPRPIAAPRWPAGPDPRPIRIAVIGSIVCLALLGVVVTATIPRRFRDDRSGRNLD